MATDAPPPKGSTDDSPAQPTTEAFVAVQDSTEFAELRRAHRSFAFPLTIAFVTWYLLYVLLCNYAGGFMSTKVVGNINMALVFGLAQFATTFLIAWLYSRHAARSLDPKAEAIKSRMEADA
ncbi:DUF485 domain-containing protein [Streptomyces sp. BE147]|uniref:DUF485 domain-containing protein n=1 Tax=unclassified Streptomyces TaxID=2593676 RepID=UPI002E774F27|nr:DUF485 domain-containing protein [Streptomyces sp. BE147]MEE1737490.1 DUF485 domain-containing protein [Streptomyces sp. BE147]